MQPCLRVSVVVGVGSGRVSRVFDAVRCFVLWRLFTVPGGKPPPGPLRSYVKAFAEVEVMCQSCPSPRRERVVWIWGGEYGRIMPCTKTCCGDCYFVPRHLLNHEEYR